MWPAYQSSESLNEEEEVPRLGSAYRSRCCSPLVKVHERAAPCLGPAWAPGRARCLSWVARAANRLVVAVLFLSFVDSLETN